MSNLLDLAITLTPLPEGAPPEAIATITLRCDAFGLIHTGDLLTDLLKQSERELLRWYLEEYWWWPYEGFKQRAGEVEALLVDIGKRLYGAVFGSAGAMQVVQPWRLQANAERQISISSEVPAALSLPWELLHDEQGFLALRTRYPVSILRRLPQRELGSLPQPFEPPLRVLMVTARPEGTGFVDQRAIARELLNEMQEQIEAGAVELDFLRPPTLQALRERLSDARRPPVHVLHFDGHGVFEGELDAHDGLRLGTGGQGVVAFENDEGMLDPVDADTLAQVLQDSGVRLTVLTACQSAMGATDDVFSSVAARLIQSGVDAVAAMSTSVLVASATRYVKAFYGKLAEGISAPVAHERARQALHAEPRRHFIRRRHDEDAQPVVLRDWWMPHFYQQRPLILTPKAKRKRKQQPAALQRLSDIPAAPRYRFSGRTRELQQIERWLLRRKLVVIHGFGGNGKTALAREAADWLTRAEMYKRAFFVSFEGGGGASVLLSALVQHLQVKDDYNPDDVLGTLAKLRPVLKQQPTLVIADNLEGILPGGEASLDVEERAQLWDVLLQLSQMNAGVLLTTRSTEFGDGRMAPSKDVAYLPLGGLQPDDAYALATNILIDLGIDRKRAPYADLRDLLVQLDHHALAIQLVLPALKDHSITRIRDDFAALLPHFADDTETGRNRSLLASLEYSLRRLTEEQRALLPRLALFQGGASEHILLAITKIPETEWAALQSTLEQAALLTVERIHEAMEVPFLHFHPVLTPYLRKQCGTDDVALRYHYAVSYHAVASYLSSEDYRNPHPVRAHMRRELSNLCHAFVLLIELNELDAAIDMFDKLSQFLSSSGLWREHDKLRRPLDEALAQRVPSDNKLTYAEYLHESSLGEAELERSNVEDAASRFTRLLQRIEALPEGTSLGRGSYEHCVTLLRLARCLKLGGKHATAKARLRSALDIIKLLIVQQPHNHAYMRQRGAVLNELGNIWVTQGKYIKARTAYKMALKIAQQLGDQRNQAATHGQLGELALEQRSYAEAYKRYSDARAHFHALGEPEMESVAWHMRGIVAQEQQQWHEAERCYRESLAIREQRGYWSLAATTCNQLAIVARRAGRPSEAERWYKRALELIERVQPNSQIHAATLSNLSFLLMSEVQAGHMPQSRLVEARVCAEQALVIRESFDLSSEPWATLDILAMIAELEKWTNDAQGYRRRARETFAAFPGNRYLIDQQHGELIIAIAAAAQGNQQARIAVEQVLPQLAEWGWHISDATRRLWAGERNWHALVEGIDPVPALLIMRVLETIAQPEAALQVAQNVPHMAAIVEQFEPLLQAIAAVAAGQGVQQAEIEAVLTDLETQGWHLWEAVQRIWSGERNYETLVDELGGAPALLVRRVLDIIQGR